VLILGSNSPQRRDLLKQVGIKVDKIAGPNIDENQRAKELPREYVKRISLDKSNAIKRNDEDFLITADTIVVKGKKIFGKPKDSLEAVCALKTLSGSRHIVLTAVCVSLNNVTRIRVVETKVKMKNLSEIELEDYIKSGEWRGKAGSYAIQGRAAVFIPFISGSYSNVVGLPLTETTNLLQGMGYKPSLEEQKK